MRLIDADALPVHRVKILHPDGIYDGEVVFPEHIANATTIEAEPVRHGRWVKDDLYNTICSVCGKRIPCIEEYDTDEDCGGTYDVEIDETPRCPNCGAKMDAKENENACTN